MGVELILGVVLVVGLLLFMTVTLVFLVAVSGGGEGSICWF